MCSWDFSVLGAEDIQKGVEKSEKWRCFPRFRAENVP